MAYCLQTLSGITTDCKSNVGGMATKIYIANKEDIDESGIDAVTRTDDDGNEIIEKVNSIKCKQGKKFEEYSFRKNTCQLTNEFTINDNGTKFNTATLSLSFARQETIKRIAIEALVMGEVVVIVKDANGFQQILGLDEDPVTCSQAGSDSGKASADFNGYTLSLVDITGHFPYEYLGNPSDLTTQVV